MFVSLLLIWQMRHGVIEMCGFSGKLMWFHPSLWRHTDDIYMAFLFYFDSLTTSSLRLLLPGSPPLFDVSFQVCFLGSLFSAFPLNVVFPKILFLAPCSSLLPCSHKQSWPLSWFNMRLHLFFLCNIPTYVQVLKKYQGQERKLVHRDTWAPGGEVIIAQGTVPVLSVLQGAEEGPSKWVQLSLSPSPEKWEIIRELRGFTLVP